MPNTAPTLEQQWMLSGAPDKIGRLDDFLAAPLRRARTYSTTDGDEVLQALAAGLSTGTTPAVALALAEPHLSADAQRLCSQLRQALASGASLARAVSAHPEAFGAGLGATLESLLAVMALPDAVRSAAQLSTNAHTADDQNATRRTHLWALALTATLAAVVSTLLLDSLPSGWGTWAAHAAQLTTAAALAVAGLGHLSRRRGLLGAIGRRVLDPAGITSRHESARSSLQVLANALEAGMPARRAAQLAARSSNDARTADDLADVAAALWAGDTLPGALSKHPQLLDASHLAAATTPAAQASALRLAAQGAAPIGRHHLIGPAALAAVTWVLTLSVAVLV